MKTQSETAKRLLTALGLTSLDDLFSEVPPRYRRNADIRFDFDGGFDPRGGASERELRSWLRQLAAGNRFPSIHFLGGGTYDEPLPLAVDWLARAGAMDGKSDTELRQFLESIVARLCSRSSTSVGFPDRRSALAAALPEAGSAPATALILGEALCGPDIEGALHERNWTAKFIGVGERGNVPTDAVARTVADGSISTVIVPVPNAFGVIEELAALRRALDPSVTLVVWLTDAGILSLFSVAPADLVIGDLQPLAAPPRRSGARLAFIAGEMKLPEPPSAHPTLVRRALATLVLLGSDGLWQWGERLHSHLDYLTREFEGVGLRRRFREAITFREAVFEIPSLDARIRRALTHDVLPGLSLAASRLAPRGDFSNQLLVCIHSNHNRADLDRLVDILSHD